MPSIAEKILKEHLVEGVFEKHKEIGIRIDNTLTQDATGTRTLTLGTSWTFINTDSTTTTAGDINVYRYTVIDDTHLFLEYLDTI